MFKFFFTEFKILKVDFDFLHLFSWTFFCWACCVAHNGQLQQQVIVMTSGYSSNNIKISLFVMLKKFFIVNAISFLYCFICYWISVVLFCVKLINKILELHVSVHIRKRYMNSKYILDLCKNSSKPRKFRHTEQYKLLS